MYKLNYNFFYRNKMETVSPYSKVEPFPQTYTTEVAPTYVSFNSHHFHTLFPTTPCSSGQKDYTFSCNPSAASELHLPSCEMVTKIRLVKKNGDLIGSDAQVGCLNALGFSMWERTNVRLNGILWNPEIVFSDHFEYQKMMGCYDEKTRKALFHRTGID